jgi:hypothetical protein
MSTRTFNVIIFAIVLFGGIVLAAIFIGTGGSLVKKSAAMPDYRLTTDGHTYYVQVRGLWSYFNTFKTTNKSVAYDYYQDQISRYNAVYAPSKITVLETYSITNK